MGTWGTAILSNDTSADIKDTFFDLYDTNHNSADIRVEIEKEYKESDNIAENTDLWLTLALLQWQIGHLDLDVKQKAEEIITTGIDLNVWKENDADAKSLAKRKLELDKLFDKIQLDNPKPRKRKKKIMPTALFQKGDVFAFPLNNGKYSAIVILEEILSVDYHFTMVATTEICSTDLPTTKEVLKSNVIVKNTHQNDTVKFRPLIASCLNKQHKDIIKSFIKIGTVKVKAEYTTTFINYGVSAWVQLIEDINQYLVENKPRPNNIIHLSQYVSDSKSWFDKLFGK
jgi:hypothetical protein